MEQNIGKDIRFGPFTASLTNGAGWVRVFGRGFYYKNTETKWLSFSERNGYKKTLRLGKWLIGYLRKT